MQKLRKFTVLLVSMVMLLYTVAINPLMISAASKNEANSLSVYQINNSDVSKDVKFKNYDKKTGEYIGYKLSDVKVKTNNNKKTVHAEVFSVNRNFDKDDNLIGSTVQYSAFHKNKVTYETLSKDAETEISLTEIPKGNYDIEKFVKKHINLSNTPFKKGKEEIDYDTEIVQNANVHPNNLLGLEKNESFVTTSIEEQAGAYDNYYNLYSDNTYRVQALGSVKGYYNRYDNVPYTGNNITSYNTFKGYIDDYEHSIIVSMDYNTWADEVSNFAGNLSIFTLIGHYAGKSLKGPSGWARAAKYLSWSHMLAKLVQFTSEGYANGQRLSASFDAAEALSKAQGMLINGGLYFDDYDFSSVYGYGYYLS